MISYRRPPDRGRFHEAHANGEDAAPAGSAYATELPGASGDIARPNYVGPSGNGLVERMKAGESPWDQGRSNGHPCPFPEGGPEDEGKRRGEAPIGAPARVMWPAVPFR